MGTHPLMRLDEMAVLDDSLISITVWRHPQGVAAGPYWQARISATNFGHAIRNGDSYGEAVDNALTAFCATLNQRTGDHEDV